MGKGELEQLDSGPRHQYGLHTRDNPPGIERRNPNLEVFQQPGNRLAALFLSAATALSYFAHFSLRISLSAARW